MINKITQDEFLHRIMTSDTAAKKRYTVDALKALHGSLYDFYPETLSKEFHVSMLLIVWKEFDTLEAAKAYCKKYMAHRDYKDISSFSIVFNTGVLMVC
jgi:hypothetical protein